MRENRNGGKEGRRGGIEREMMTVRERKDGGKDGHRRENIVT